MSGGLVWLIVGLGLLVVIVRRRSVSAAIVTVQALVLTGAAVADASTSGDVVAAVALGLRALVLAAAFFAVVARTREPRPVRAGVAPLVRAAAAIALALSFSWLLPDLGLGSRTVERAALALAAFGLVTAATRRATLFQVLGIVLVENGIALAALQLPAASAVIELGVATDLLLVALVAVVFHERIFAEFGAGDAGVLRSLRDHP